MKTALFDFPLPESLIADRPASPRDSARMLVVPKSDSAFLETRAANLTEFLKPGDVLVMNDTRVMPARLIGKRGAAKVEILLLKEKEEGLWEAFARPAKRLKVGDRVEFSPDFWAEIVQFGPGRTTIMAQLGVKSGTFRAHLQRSGLPPLPPYIAKKRATDARDTSDYQTVYANADKSFSVAAPTAGLHFTPELLAATQARGVKHVHVTLHVGAGTFLPVKAEDTNDHLMHAEHAHISPESAAIINAARAAGGRVVAVGTTSLRVLESAADADGIVQPIDKETSIFITPGYRFKAVDMLLTNFHLPKSTLFMLVCAFAGYERMRAAYAHATSQHYRFYSYGDACLLYRKDP